MQRAPDCKRHIIEALLTIFPRFRECVSGAFCIQYACPDSGKICVAGRGKFPGEAEPVRWKISRPTGDDSVNHVHRSSGCDRHGSSGEKESAV